MHESRTVRKKKTDHDLKINGIRALCVCVEMREGLGKKILIARPHQRLKAQTKKHSQNRWLVKASRAKNKLNWMPLQRFTCLIRQYDTIRYYVLHTMDAMLMLNRPTQCKQWNRARRRTQFFTSRRMNGTEPEKKQCPKHMCLPTSKFRTKVWAAMTKVCVERNVKSKN